MKLEQVGVDALEAWDAAGRRLSRVDPERFSRVLALARAYVANHDRELENQATFQSRIAQIVPAKVKASG